MKYPGIEDNSDMVLKEQRFFGTEPSSMAKLSNIISDQNFKHLWVGTKSSLRKGR